MPTTRPRTAAAALHLVERFRSRELGRAATRPVVAAANTQAAAQKRKAPSPRVPNPFLSQRDETRAGRWDEPKYSRRRQAELVKAARISGTLHLLPPGPKLRPGEIADFRDALERKQREEKAATVVAGEGHGRRKKKTIQVLSDAKLERHVVWTGRVWDKPAKGHDVGARLYVRKRYMFKGHAWEKVTKLRKKFIAVRLRSQKRRIDKWHATRIIKRNPFKPVRRTARLPF